LITPHRDWLAELLMKDTMAQPLAALASAGPPKKTKSAHQRMVSERFILFSNLLFIA
jgi:hypothetical protein